ncbi:7119_t:CDS:10 [Ambispora gerdemannii]|uniref:7119_t:CDS:1 n=1 Tax=Ambispora gerdemannii TaxID=144530 RepID=A0A9N9CZT5_9GLOM|nr:7119_t:CDS:10 [Ambispora gerdemannii]
MAEKNNYNLFFDGSEESQYYDYDSPTSSHRPAPKPPIHLSPYSQYGSNIPQNNNSNTYLKNEDSRAHRPYAPPRNEEPSYPPPHPPSLSHDSYTMGNNSRTNLSQQQYYSNSPPNQYSPASYTNASNSNPYLPYKQENRNHPTQEILNPPRLATLPDQHDDSQISYSDKMNGRIEIRRLLLKLGFFLVIAFIVSIIVVAVIALVNQQKCKSLSVNDAQAFKTSNFIDDRIGNQPWKFTTSGKFIDAQIIVNSNQPEKQDETRVYFETRMIAAKEETVRLVDLSSQGEFLFEHSGNAKSETWKNYLSFPPICAKVQVDLWFAQNATFTFSVDVKNSDFSVKGWPN